MNLPDRAADAAASSAVIVPAAAFMAELNVYLQAGAFIVAMISGILAARYYWKKANEVKP